MNAEARAVQAFEATYGHAPSIVARAPGRVNVIGEHTDYNDGFALPVALPFATVIAAEVRPGQTVAVASEGFGAATFAIDGPPAETTPWARYLHGMGACLAEEGLPLAAWKGTIATDIPAGASLSSSAALEVAAGLLYSHAAGASIDVGTVARLGQRVENEVMRLPSGIMDQLASARSTAGHASLIDCRDLTITPAPLPDGVTLVVMDTGTRRELVDSAYAERRDTCMRVAEAIGVRALRDATLADLDALPADDDVGRRRATHVITENARTLAAVDAMRAGDTEELGRLMDESHRSLRDDYEVSGPALDAMVEIARTTPGCLGARMTGGGFAGGTIAIVLDDAVDRFCAVVTDRYRAPDTQPAVAPARLYPIKASAGASLTSR